MGRRRFQDQPLRRPRRGNRGGTPTCRRRGRRFGPQTGGTRHGSLVVLWFVINLPYTSLSTTCRLDPGDRHHGRDTRTRRKKKKIGHRHLRVLQHTTTTKHANRPPGGSQHELWRGELRGLRPQDIQLAAQRAGRQPLPPRVHQVRQVQRDARTQARLDFLGHLLLLCRCCLLRGLPSLRSKDAFFCGIGCRCLLRRALFVPVLGAWLV